MDYKEFTKELVKRLDNNVESIRYFNGNKFEPENSRNSFKIKELDGWLWGIWFDKAKNFDITNATDNTLLVRVFTQYYIYKFDPSAATDLFSFECVFEELNEGALNTVVEEVKKIFDFIYNNFYLACYADNNFISDIEELKNVDEKDVTKEFLSKYVETRLRGYYKYNKYGISKIVDITYQRCKDKDIEDMKSYALELVLIINSFYAINIKESI